MKGFARLVGNENRKTLKQIGMRVLLIIIAAITVLSPVLSFAVSKLSNTTYTDYQYDPENIEGSLQYAREEGDKLYEEYWLVYRDTVSFFEENNLNSPWQTNAFRNDYSTTLGFLRACELISSGSFTAQEVSESMFSEFIWQYTDSADYYTDDDQYYETDDTVEASDPLEILSPENISKTTAEARKRFDEIKSNALNFTLSDYYGSRVEEAKAAYDAQVQAIENYKKGGFPSVGNPKLDADLAAYRLAVAELELQGKELYLWCCQKLKDNLWEYGSWQFKTASSLASRFKAPPAPVMSKELFNSDSAVTGIDARANYKSYSEYVNATEAALSSWNEAMALTRYSLENGIPIKGTVDNSSKQMFRSELKSAMSLLVIFMIVLACMTLSNEYTSGTIRLLLIRPRGRAKIIGSKIVSMLLLWLSAIAAVTVLLFAECLVLFGVSDMFKPDLFYIGGAAAVPAPVTLICQILLDMLSTAPIIMIGILLSVWIKKSALPIALSMIGRFSTSIALVLSITLNSGYSFLHLEYTPLPYLDLTNFIGNAAEQMMPASLESVSGIFNFLWSTIFGELITNPAYKLWIGITWMVLLTTLATVLTFVSFKKQQIKN